MHPELVEQIGALAPDTLHLVRCWQHYRAGFLWRAGGVADQPNRYLEAMELLSAEVSRRQRQDAERQRWWADAGVADAGKARLKIHGMPGAGRR